MKKLTFFLFIMAFVALPMWSIACDPATDPTCVTSVVDIKGYADQSANFSIGAFDVQQKVIEPYSATEINKEWSFYGNQATASTECVGGNCGMIQSVGSFSETVKNITNALLTSTMAGFTVQGSAEMHQMGGLAACVTKVTGGDLIPFQGSVVQNQTVAQNYNINLGTTLHPNIGTGSASYTGTQNFKLQVGGP